MFRFYKFWINPDGVAYLSIAEKYSHGNFGDALNGYWGPMISWLLTPFYLLDKNPLIGARLIFIAAGLCSLVLAYLLLSSYNVKAWILKVFIGCFVPLLAYWTMAFSVTPDILVVVVFLLYLYVLTREDLRFQPVLIGVVGALGYYTKAFILVFFVLHTAVLYLIGRYKDKQKSPRSMLITLGVTVVLVLPWIILLSQKYDKPTFSTTSTFIYKIFNPANPQGFPTDYIGLVAPPNDSALSAWEDPTYLPISDWNPFSSLSGLVVLYRLFIDNIRRIGDVLLRLSILALTAFLGLVIRLISKWQRLDRQETILASSTIIYMFGMAIALVEYRYMLPALTGLLLWSAFAANELKLKKFKNHALATALLIIIATIVVSPLNQLYFRRHEQSDLFRQTDALRAFIEPGEHVASDNFDTIRFCFVLRAKCYGRLNPAQTVEENRKQLAASRITTVVIRHGGDTWTSPAYLSDYHEVIRLGETIVLKKN